MRKGSFFSRQTTAAIGRTVLLLPNASRITFSHILKNGNILFATGAKTFTSAPTTSTAIGKSK